MPELAFTLFLKLAGSCENASDFSAAPHGNKLLAAIIRCMNKRLSKATNLGV